jgi:hypothetical protein
MSGIPLQLFIFGIFAFGIWVLDGRNERKCPDVPVRTVKTIQVAP